MDIAELYDKLKGIGLTDSEIYLHGLYGSADDNEKLSMTIKKGKYTMIWEVYYRERGEKHSVREFNNEAEACEYYFQKIKRSKSND